VACRVNRVRPHEALGGKTPSELYKPSERRLVATKFIYPPDWIIRTVTDAGAVNVAGAQIKAGLALVRQRVALQPLGGTSHRLWFRDLDLGTVELPPSNAVIDAVARAHVERPLAMRKNRMKSKKAA
jgi:putative transposase